MVGLAGLLVILFTITFSRVDSTIVLVTASNYSLPFPDIEASFAPRVPTIGVMGVIFAANPLNACESLQIGRPNVSTAFLLVERGECDFVTKVKHVQDAGYAAAIIYNNEDGEDLVTMSGSGTSIDIYAVFVSKQAGEALQRCAGDMDSRCYLFPAFQNTARSLMAISFISLLTVFAVLSTLFFVRRHRLRSNGAGLLQREPGGMASKDVNILPIVLFDSANRASIETCAICLEEYTRGEKLRLLPCGHEFHVACIDQWLTTRRPFCPICKQDAHSNNTSKPPPPSEQTPLLASSAHHFSSMDSSPPLSAQDSLIRPSTQNRGHFDDLFATTPHTMQHALSCPLSQFYGENDEENMSHSHLSNTVVPSSTGHNIGSLNSSPCSCYTHVSAAPIGEEEVVVEVNSDE